MAEIKDAISRGEYFPCHKTTGKRHSAEAEHGGWDYVPVIEKLTIIAKEQTCKGAEEWLTRRS